MNVLYHHRTRGEDVEGVHIRGIINGLRELGHEVDVVSPPGVDVEHAPPPKTATAVAAATKARKPKRPSRWTTLSSKTGGLVFEGAEMAYNAYSWPMLSARLASRDYALLYERYALFSVAGVMAAHANRVPIILEVNDSAVVNRIRPLRLQAAARRVERFVWNRADAIVTITHYFRDLILETGVSADRVHVIPNAVDDAAFSGLPDAAPLRQQLGLTGKVTIGYVGAINFWRRLDLLVGAFAEVAPRYPAAHLVLIGDGPDKAGVADQANALGLRGRITFTGKVPHAEIPAHLAALDIAVIPHSNTYGSPMKLFEYMAAGKLTVAPWLPPIVSVIGEDDGGVLFPPLDQAGLARALDGLLGDADRRARLGARAREKVLSDYVWRRHAQTILDINARLGPR
ncbi:MAG TPA: glycosyltransferase family 4 protein [Kofleriaceae bacterium]|nr:glycosyltransferase family 4 protein [Kofleriaceae bacterium]